MKKIYDLETLNLKSYHDIFDGAKTIAVVGSGEVEEDAYEHIEKADKVIRFNDFNRRKNFNPKSTHRCDLLFTHFDIWPIIKKGYCDNIKNIIIAIPYPFHCERIIKRVEDTCLDSSIYTVNPYIQYELCQLLGYNSEGYKHPSPTVGMTCLYHLSLLIDRMDVKPKVHISGFDWHVDFHDLIIDQKPMTLDCMPKHWNHFYAAEGRWCVWNLLNADWVSLSKRSNKALIEIKEAHDERE